MVDLTRIENQSQLYRVILHRDKKVYCGINWIYCMFECFIKEKTSGPELSSGGVALPKGWRRLLAHFLATQS